MTESIEDRIHISYHLRYVLVTVRHLSLMHLSPVNTRFNVYRQHRSRSKLQTACIDTYKQGTKAIVKWPRPNTPDPCLDHQMYATDKYQAPEE